MLRLFLASVILALGLEASGNPGPVRSGIVLAQQSGVDLAVSLDHGGPRRPTLVVGNYGFEDAEGVRVTIEYQMDPDRAVGVEVEEAEEFEVPVGRLIYDPAHPRRVVWEIGKLPARSQYTMVVENLDFPSPPNEPSLNNVFLVHYVISVDSEYSYVESNPGNERAAIWKIQGSGQDLAFSAAYSVEATVDNPFPQPGSDVVFDVVFKYDSLGDQDGEHFLSDAYVQIDLTPRLSYRSHIVHASPNHSDPDNADFDENTGRWNIIKSSNIVQGGPWSNFEVSADGVHRLTLTATLADGVALGEHCLTAEAFNRDPQEIGLNGEDPLSDNRVRVCLGVPSETNDEILLDSGEIALFTLHDYVGETAYPCDSANNANNDGLELVIADRGSQLDYLAQPRNVTIRVPDGEEYRTIAGNKVVWSTGNPPDSHGDGGRPGIRVLTSAKLNTDSWGVPHSTVPNISVGAYKIVDGPDSGTMAAKYIFNETENEFWTIDSARLYQADEYGLGFDFAYFIEFDRLGTFATTHEFSALHDAGTDGDTTDDETHSDRETYTFHVGPAADLEVRGGDSGVGVGPGQTALTVLAVNNGPDNALGAKVDVDLNLPDGVTVRGVNPSVGAYANGVWNLGALWHKGLRRLTGQPESETLTFILEGADAASASLTATIYHDNENHPYTVCIDGSDASDVDAASEGACDTAGGDWHEGTVYDYRDNNNTATVGARADITPPAEPGLVKVEGGPLALHEGGEADEYTIVLGSRPSHDVRIRVSSDNRDVALDTDDTTEGNQNTLTFTPFNWPNPQTVKVSAAHDADAVNDTATLTHTASSSDGGFNGIRIATVSVDVDDDEPPEIHLTPLPLPTLNEGDTATYTVALTTPPSVGSVPLELFVFGDEDIEVRPAAFTLNRSNWERGQMVTVTARQDDDGQDDTASIVHVPAANAAAEYRGKIAEQVVNVLDDDVPGVRLSALSRQVIPEGQTATYTARLNVAPAANVTITLASDNLGVAVDTDPATGAYENTLTFTPDNATVEQTVTVIALNDDNAADETATITGTLGYTHPDPATGEDYTGITVPDVSVTVDDDETAGITLSKSALAIVEGLNGVTVTDTYTVALATEPTGSVTIGLSSDNGDVTVSPAPLTFTPSGGAMPWNVPQTVTVAVADDADSLPDTATITHAVNDAGSADEYGGLSAGLKVTVEDSDVPGLTFNPAELMVEENATETYDVVLNVEPSLDVTVRISSNNSDVTVEPSTLTFTGGASGNWNMPQTVNVSAVVDSDENDDTLRLTHRMDRSEAPEYRSKTVVLEGTVTETMVDYANENGLIEIRTQQQLNAVRWDLDGNGKPDAGPAGNEDKEYRRAFPQYGNCQDSNRAPQDCVGYVLMNDITLSGNWTPIGGNQHFDEFSDYPEYLATFDGNGKVIRNLRINRSDGKYVGLFGAISGGKAVIRNVGVPDADVRGRDLVGVLVGRNNGGRIEYAWSTGQVSGNTFTGGLVGWNQGTVAQSYSEAIVSGWNASDSGGPLWSTRIAGLVGANHGTIENSYAAGEARGRGHVAGLAGENNGTIRNSYSTAAVSTEDDWPHKGGLVGWQQSGTVENSYWETELDGKHKGVSKGVAQGSETGITGQTDKQLQEPVGYTGIYKDWNVDIDGDNMPDDPWNFRSDREYPCLSGVGSCPAITAPQQQAPEPVPATETGRVTVTPTELSLNEGGSTTYTVVLETRPVGNVLISVFASGVTAQPDKLTFTSDNWQTAQTVTVSAAQDEDTEDETAYINHGVGAGPDSGYSGVPVPYVTVSIIDDDEPAAQAAQQQQAEPGSVTVSLSSLFPREGDTGLFYTVVLDAEPTGNVVIAVSSDNGDVAPEPASLTFAPDNWQTPQAVTVSASEDGDRVDDWATISHRASGGNYDGVTVDSVIVAVTDDDTDREVLRDFYQATGGQNWTNKANWLSDQPLGEWHGVTVNGQDQVTAIVLDRNNLTGSLPAELGKLQSLTRLALNRNSLTGVIPSELGRLPNLSIIGLARNSLSGALPASLGNLTGMTRLSLHDNTGLSGPLPAGIGNMPLLTRLALSNTGLSGELPQGLISSLMGYLHFDGTNLCAPADEEFQTWLDGVPDKNGPTCGS